MTQHDPRANTLQICRQARGDQSIMKTWNQIRSFRVALWAITFFLPTQVSTAAIDYDTQVRPILQLHCTKCHGQKSQKGELRLDTLSPNFLEDRRAAERWHDVREALNRGDMPPSEEPKLQSKQRQILVQWIDEQIAALGNSKKSTKGRVVLRRLNRAEYQNTMKDLLGVDTNYVQNLPPEGYSSDGFQNNGSELQMSDLQLEYYLEAARNGLQKAIVNHKKPKVYRHEFTHSITDKKRGSNFLNDDEQFIAKLMEYPAQGEFLIRVKARAKLVQGRGYPQLRAAIGYRADVRAPRHHMPSVDVVHEDWQTFEFRDRIEHFPLPSKSQSKFPGLLIWLDNIYAEGFDKRLKPKRSKKIQKAPKSKNANLKTSPPQPLTDYPNIEIASLEFIGPLFDEWPPKHHRKLLFHSPDLRQDEPAYASAVLKRFIQKAFRRPVSAREISPYLRFFANVRQKTPSFEEAIRETMAMVLISPDFLYLFEPAAEQKRRLTDWELASRLSYFLWSTMPDQELMELAEQGTLREPNVLRSQVKRMVHDERSWQFVEQFADQWLDARAVDRVAVNPEFYPDFNPRLKASMRLETLHFFAEILEKNLSAINFLDSDFTMLNEPLAAHYGLQGPRGSSFERVQLLPSDNRGGVIANASILLGNSTGEDSHPVKRAVWIRERLLDNPPSDPPANVPNLNSTDPKFASLSVQDQLRLHRTDPACNDCHRAIDPWGIALENFGADGRWRDNIPRRKIKGKGMARQPVVAKTTLPDGTVVAGLQDLKSYLVNEKQDQFSRAFVTKLLTYSLGRSLELTDEATVDQLDDKFSESNFRIEPLIQSIVASEPFQFK